MSDKNTQEAPELTSEFPLPNGAGEEKSAISTAYDALKAYLDHAVEYKNNFGFSFFQKEIIAKIQNTSDASYHEETADTPNTKSIIIGIISSQQDDTPEHCRIIFAENPERITIINDNTKEVIADIDHTDSHTADRKILDELSRVNNFLKLSQLIRNIGIYNNPDLRSEYYASEVAP